MILHMPWRSGFERRGRIWLIGDSHWRHALFKCLKLRFVFMKWRRQMPWQLILDQWKMYLHHHCIYEWFNNDEDQMDLELRWELFLAIWEVLVSKTKPICMLRVSRCWPSTYMESLLLASSFSSSNRGPVILTNLSMSLKEGQMPPPTFKINSTPKEDNISCHVMLFNCLVYKFHTIMINMSTATTSFISPCVASSRNNQRVG